MVDYVKLRNKVESIVNKKKQEKTSKMHQDNEDKMNPEKTPDVNPEKNPAKNPPKSPVVSKQQEETPAEEASKEKSKPAEEVKDKEETSKMEFVTKFEDAKVDALKKVLEEMKKLGEAKEIKAEDVKKLTGELEAAITVEAKPAPAEEKKEETAKDAKPEEKKEDAKPEEKAEDKKEEAKADPAKADAKPADEAVKEEAKPAVEDKKEEAKPADETSKQSDLTKAYKGVADEAVTKMKELSGLYSAEKDKNEALTKTNLKLQEEVSKFKEDTHQKLVGDVLGEMSKFKELDDKAQNNKRDEISKMSDTALGIMKAEFKEMNVSKLEEEKTETKSSQELDKKEAPKEDAEKIAKNAEIKKSLKNIYG